MYVLENRCQRKKNNNNHRSSLVTEAEDYQRDLSKKKYKDLFDIYSKLVYITSAISLATERPLEELALLAGS